MRKISAATLSVMLTASLISTGDALASSMQRFTDVPAGHWASDAITRLVDSDVVHGYEDGSFKPNAYITQEEFIAMAAQILYGKADAAPVAEEDIDVPPRWSDWAYESLAKHGITSLEDFWASDGDKRLIQITRAEAARIIYMLFNGNVENLSSKVAVKYLYEHNLTSGTYSDRGDYFANYGPTELLTRAQAAVFLTKIKDYKAGVIKPPSKPIKADDTLASRIKAIAQKAGVNVTASLNTERYQTRVEGSGITLDFQFDEFAYGDLGENWHMTIIKLDKNRIGLMTSILRELGLPMNEKETRALLTDLLALEYGQTGETYKKGNISIHTSYYFGYHVQWGEHRNNDPQVATNAKPYALFVNGEEKRGPEFNTFLEPIFDKNGTVYVPVSDVVPDMGGSWDMSVDWNVVTVVLKEGYQWVFEWDGVPKKNGSTFIGTSIGMDDSNITVKGISKGGSLFLPLDFVSKYYPVTTQMEGETTLILIGTVPEHPTANYFGAMGQYPSTFDFNPLDPNMQYPGGWKAPQLTSKWSSNPADNFKAFENELGFTDGGRYYSVTGMHHAITVMDQSDSKDTEVTLSFTGWGTPPGKPDATVSESFKIPVVSAQLFRFYFEDKWKSVWDYFNRNDIPEQFTLNGRKVNVSYSHLTGIMTVEIGRKSK
ncbi:S-layer homology domain-containing protein [Paenibacillus sp. M1]|uniref:S-layer homology domain-containing protein n=1 Tax=Paenibacillus haidiansis TaxID=1574488 RepID=A0ABU7VZB2_9BACL